MINKTKINNVVEYSKHWLLSLLLLQNIFCSVISGTDNKHLNSDSLPKIITLQTYKDWSSRLGSTANQTTPQTTAFVFEESKDVRTTYGGQSGINRPSITSTQDTSDSMRKSLITAPNAENQTKSNNMSAHGIAAQVLSRILYISPLLAMASNADPSRRPIYNDSIYKNNKFIQKLPLIESMNEIETEPNVNQLKSERKSASGISFPTIPTTTTDMSALLYETTPADVPTEYPFPHPDEEEHNHPSEEPTDSSEDEESPSMEESDDYEDDEEMESFRYPVRVTFQDSDDEQMPEPDTSPPFVIPNINLNPEAMKQKGCRTIVKEVQAIPVDNELDKQLPNHKNGIKRMKRNSDGNGRKFTSIVMTKECHFPDDENASSEEVPQTLASNTMSDFKPDKSYQTPSPPNFDEYDEDFDFKPRLTYPSSDLSDRLEPKSSNDRKSYADNPIFRRDNSEYIPPKEEFDFDDSSYYDLNDKPKNRYHQRPQNARPKRNRQKQMSSSPSSSYDFDDEEFGPQPRKRTQITQTNSKSRQKRPKVYQNERNGRNSRNGKHKKHQRKPKRKPKKINRSFAFFRRAEPKEKDPNESDYSVSYGRGNFQSFSDSYDSDKDGPRSPGKSRSVKYDK